MIRTISGPCVTALFVAGCVIPVDIQHDQYPMDWPALAPASTGCPDLSGRFSNADSVSGKVLLTSWWLADTGTQPEVISVVEFDGPRGKVVTLHLYEGSGASLTERRRHQWKEGDDYLCDSGWLVWSRTDLVFPFGVAVDNTAGRFTLARDGSLIVERREGGAGVILVVPVYRSIGKWFRHMRVDASPWSSAPNEPR